MEPYIINTCIVANIFRKDEMLYCKYYKKMFRDETVVLQFFTMIDIVLLCNASVLLE